MAIRKIITISNNAAGYGLLEDFEKHKFQSARLFVEGAHIRFWSTPGAAPTASEGLILFANQMLPLGTPGEIDFFRAIREDTTDATLYVELFE